MKYPRLRKISLIIILLLAIIVFVFYYANNENRNITAFPITPLPNKTLSCEKNIFTILSLDGGGIRGIIPLYFLAQIEKATNQPIRNSFNLIAGVSVGALIATGLSLPDKTGKPLYSAQDILRLFPELSEKIFTVSTTRKIVTLSGLIAPIYSAKNKYHYLKKWYPENYSLNNLLGNVMIVGFDFKKNNILTFCNWKGCPPIKYQYSLLNILSGATSPLGFFTPGMLYDTKGNLEYILADSTYTLKNPALIAYLYGEKACHHVNAKYYFVLSLGTGEYPVDSPSAKSDVRFGVLHSLPKIMLGMYLGEHRQVEVIMKTLKDKKLIFVRINPTINAKEFSALQPSPDSFSQFAKSGKKIISDHPKLFQCIEFILKNRILTSQCETEFSHYED